MNDFVLAWQVSLQNGLTYAVTQTVAFLPRLLGALLVFFIGLAVVRFVRSIVVRTLETQRISKMVEKTPLEHFLKNAEFGQKFEEVVGGIVYWLLLFVVLYIAVAVLGLTPISTFMDRILGYVPHVFSALFIFFFGVLLAGLAESVVKGGLRSLHASSARLIAKIMSYMVVSVAVLAAVAELGIASEFIKILFFGLVFSFALGSGLAIGLGGQHTVRKLMDDWYQRTHE